MSVQGGEQGEGIRGDSRGDVVVFLMLSLLVAEIKP
jgi:hypothetical protein